MITSRHILAVLAISMLALQLGLSGCALYQKSKPVVAEAPVKKTPPKQIVKPVVQAKSEVAIILSSGSPAYTSIASLLVSELGKRAKTYNLDGDITRGKTVLKLIKKSNQQQIVAIGLLATRVAQTIKDKQVFFCQVFNHEDLGLASSRMKGVSLVPSQDILFGFWKKLDPNLRHVAVITGSNKDGLIMQAKKAAKKRKIKLTHVKVKTDLDMLHAAKNLPSDVQGIWLLPDNRVLSRRAIKDLMTYGVKHGKQLAVFQPELLKLGGLFSIRHDEKDVVAQTLKRLAKADHKEKIPGAPVNGLKSAYIQINTVVANRMGLLIPREYKEYIHEL